MSPQQQTLPQTLDSWLTGLSSEDLAYYQMLGEILNEEPHEGTAGSFGLTELLTLTMRYGGQESYTEEQLVDLLTTLVVLINVESLRRKGRIEKRGAYSLEEHADERDMLLRLSPQEEGEE